MGWIRRHLTYANVISTLCLFILLGGGAYAAFHLQKNSVRSKNIVNGSIKGKDIKQSGITGKSVKNKSLRDADIQGLETSDGLVRMEPGDTVTLLTRGPFTLTADCRIDHNPEGDGLFSEVLVDSSVPGGELAINATSGGNPVPPQQTVVETSSSVSDPHDAFEAQPFALATPDGTTVTGFAAAGVYSLGSTCYALATGLGGTGLPSG
jgi:hypothetical protein